jgi:hypothetical protein
MGQIFLSTALRVQMRAAKVPVRSGLSPRSSSDVATRCRTSASAAERS